MNLIKMFSIAIILLSVMSCGKETTGSSTATGYPQVSVKCGNEACIK